MIMMNLGCTLLNADVLPGFLLYFDCAGEGIGEIFRIIMSLFSIDSKEGYWNGV